MTNAAVLKIGQISKGLVPTNISYQKEYSYKNENYGTHFTTVSRVHRTRLYIFAMNMKSVSEADGIQFTVLRRISKN